MFFTWLSATVFHILSGIICITAVLGYGFGDVYKRQRETATEQPPQSPNLANLLMKYLSVQREKSRKYSQRWQQQHTADELQTIAAAVNYLSEHGISNLDELDASLSAVSDLSLIHIFAAVILVERLIFTSSPPPVFHIESGGRDLLVFQMHGDLVAVFPADKQTENQTDNLGGFFVDYPKILVVRVFDIAVRAVSYTHLDVYKRQGLPCTMVTFPKGIYGSQSHSTVCVSTSLMRIISTVSSCGGSFKP